ncbi:DUF262 domain-containing protein, partial [Candidatus Bathyarchaeota archaeon]|nr:DUF262 domain-containing protein [Candidatus Bathyarchaeota archaeon]
VEDWSIEKLHKDRIIISYPEYQRQDNLWSDDKKALLIDSILRNIDIPKLYFSKTENESYEVIDGHQRLWAIWQFLDDEYSIKMGGKSLKFQDLSHSQQEMIKKATLQISILDGADDEYLRDLFLRLQFGLPLITGEKLHAASGLMKDYIFRDLCKCKFIVNIGIPCRRYAKETLAAQICINSFNREKNNSFARTRYEDLKYFFLEYAHPTGIDHTYFTRKIKKIDKIMTLLWEYFGSKASELRNRSYILSIYLLLEELQGNNEDHSEAFKKLFVNFIIILWKKLKDEVRMGFSRTNKELYSLETLLSSAPGEKYQIEGRHIMMRENFEYFRKTQRIKGEKVS